MNNSLANKVYTRYKISKSLCGHKWSAGDRVKFKEAGLFAYADAPMPGTLGSVVKVRTASGDTIEYSGRIFVKWDTGGLRLMEASHLHLLPRSKKASVDVMFAPSIFLKGFQINAFNEEEGELIHKATKDLWSYEKTPNGGFSINRLFSMTGDPLKV